jgi:CRISPR-associated protein Csx3
MKMRKIKFDVREEEYSIVSFEIDGVISPEDLAALTPPKVDGSKGVILSGRGPIWFYCFLTHFYHPTKFIATYDPRLEGAVIVETHSLEHAIGSVLNLKYHQEDEEEKSE